MEMNEMCDQPRKLLKLLGKKSARSLKGVNLASRDIILALYREYILRYFLTLTGTFIVTQ